MKLSEIANQQNPEIERIKQELKRIGVTKYEILPDLSVDVSGNVFIPQEYTSIPVQFNRVSGLFICNYTKITSLEGAPQHVGGELIICGTDIASLRGVEKWIPNIKVDGKIWCDQTHILGLALIEGINQVKVWDERIAMWIKFDISHHDPFQFQEQLLECRLTEQASL